jgi:hypothetical protein
MMMVMWCGRGNWSEVNENRLWMRKFNEAYILSCLNGKLRFLLVVFSSNSCSLQIFVSRKHWAQKKNVLWLRKIELYHSPWKFFDYNYIL